MASQLRGKSYELEGSTMELKDVDNMLRQWCRGHQIHGFFKKFSQIF